MLLDIRLPVGLLFLAIGAIVAARGLEPGATAITGLPIDLIWGAVMAAFGAVMLTLALLARRRADRRLGGLAIDQSARVRWKSAMEPGLRIGMGSPVRSITRPLACTGSPRTSAGSSAIERRGRGEHRDPIGRRPDRGRSAASGSGETLARTLQLRVAGQRLGFAGDHERQRRRIAHRLAAQPPEWISARWSL